MAQLVFYRHQPGNRELCSLIMIMSKSCGCKREEALLTKEVVVEIPILHVLVHQNLVIEHKPRLLPHCH